MRGEEKPGPHQRTSYDLSKDSYLVRRHGGKKDAPIDNTPSDKRTPDDLMRQMGFEPSKSMNPLQFLLAVMNDDLDAIFKNEARRKRMEQKGGMALSYRLEAAKTASKYMHMELPKVSIQKDETNGFGEALSNAIEKGNERSITRRMILEEVQNISPDLPLAPASYPPEFEAHIDHIVDADKMVEGDTNYDPDAEE